MLDRFEFRVTAFDVGHDARAGETGFGGLADLRPGAGVDRRIQGDLEGRKIANVDIRDDIHRSAVDPGEQGVTKLGRYRDNSRRAVDAAALEEAQGAEFGLKPIAVVGLGIFLQRVATRSRIDLEDAAVVSLAKLRNRPYRLGAQHTGD